MTSTYYVDPAALGYVWRAYIGVDSTDSRAAEAATADRIVAGWSPLRAQAAEEAQETVQEENE